MKIILRQLLLTITSISVISCSTSLKDDVGTTIYVSIEPTRWVVESIADSTVTVKVLVPGATSPETFEPTARQIAELSNSSLYLTIGHFGFEGELAERMAEGGCPVADLSKGIEMLEGVCNHHHHGVEHHHSHGVDPHIWLSPKTMAIITNNAAEQLDKLGVLNKHKRDSLLVLIAEVDSTINSLRSSSKTSAFAIVHPSLGYFAKDYNLRQIALEVDGKEPSIKSIRHSLDSIKHHRVHTILHSSHDSDNAARVLSDETKLPLTSFEPLSYNWPETINEVAEAIFITQ